MRSRSTRSFLAGLGVMALIGFTGVHPVYADSTTAPTPSPSETVTGTPTETPADPPTTDPPTTDPPTTDPPTTDPPTTDPPTTDPPTTDPPTTDPPNTDPPTTDPPTTDPPTTDPPTTDPPTTDPPTTDPTPDDPGDLDKPKTPVLSLGLSVSSATVRPGGSVTATVRVSSAHATAHNTVLRMSASGVSVSPRTQRLGSVGGGGASAIATVRAPSGADPGVVTVKAAVSAAKARGASRTYKLIVTDASGAPPPGVSLADLPPGIPPLTPSDFNPLAGMKGPQVALPPVASPEIAASPMPLIPVAGLTATEEEMLTVEGLSAVQAGFLAGMAISVMMMLLRLRLARRPLVPFPRKHRRRLQRAGKRLTEARLRTLPPQPAPRPVRIVWLPIRPARVARL